MTNDTTDPAALSPLKRAFLALQQAQARIDALEGAAREPVAIVGLACRVPGAEDAQAFWKLLEDGVDAIGPVPDGRFDLDALHSPGGEAAGRTITREAGFLRSVDRFDPAFFGIARREAHGMDPQQRLLLEVSWEALENAGAAPDRLERSATGVYFGVCSNDYANLQLQADDPSLIDAHYTSGLAHSVASGRVSYVLGLQGPSVTVDTACSSSLVSVHLACQALRAGDCRMALAGGVNLMLSPDLFVAFSHSRMLAPDGRCKTFDAAADGFARGEGCGVVVLKRLCDAQADGDRVLALIRASAVNQDGPSSGLTAPNGPAQQAVIREALVRAGIEPRQVGYIEAHGTGTQLGDPLEVQALGAVFGPDRDPQRPLAIGSVKTNVGHLEAAAGVTGLIKLVLALRRRTLPAHLHFRDPSPHIAWDEMPLRVPTRAEPWEPIDGRRIAGVSSFGFSGTNAHVVLEEAPAAPELPAPEPGRAELFILSAKDAASLGAVARGYAEAFAARADAELAGLCHAAAIAKAKHPHRAAILARTVAELRERLSALAEGREAPGLRTARVTRREPPRVAFLFTGQGAQYAGMGRALDRDESVFRAALDRCAAVLDPLLGMPLREVMFGENTALLDRTAYTQPALFSLEYALCELWRAWGVRPDVVIGHSVGEYVAACLAGVMPLEDALRLIAERGRLMQSLPAGGAMAAINAPEAEVAAALAALGSGAPDIAAINGASQTVVSGKAGSVQAACDAFSARGVRCTSLPVSHAFHSALVEPILDAFEAAASRARLGRAQLRVVSNVTGQLATPEELAQPSYWRRHLRAAVRFADGMRSVAALRPDACVEVGPHPTLLGLAAGALDPAACAMAPSLRKGRADAEQLAESLGTLFLAGHDVDWRAVWSARRRPLVDLPAYPFQRERCWFEARPRARVAASGRDTGHPLLGVQLRSALADTVQYERVLCESDLPFLRDHRVQGRSILPATGFIEMALAAGHRLFGKSPHVQDVVIVEPLAFAEGERRVVQAVVRREAPDRASFQVLSSTEGSDDAWTRHAQALLRVDATEPSTPPQPVAAARARCEASRTSAEHLASLASLGLEFGPSLQGLRSLRRRDGEAVAEVELPASAREPAGAYRFHPALLDACLQGLAAAMPAGAASQAFLPLAFDEIVVHRAPGDAVSSHVRVDATAGAGASTLRAEVAVHDEAGIVAELRGILMRPAPRASAAESPLYEIAWEPADAAWWPAPGALARRVGPSLEALARENDLDRHHRATLALESHARDWIVRAMRELGWQPRAGESATTAQLAQRLGVLPRYHRLLARLLGILAEDGLLERDGERWIAAGPWPEGDPAAEAESLLARHGDAPARFVLVSRCGSSLAGILRGSVDPLQQLFPDGSSELAESLYRDTPESRTYNRFTRDAVLAGLESMPRGARVKVLEVGGGTGGTTGWLAPALRADRTEYLFTDLGAWLVARARERFGATHPFMRFQAFDLEQDANRQGVGSERFDLVVASNVIHATADLRRTLERLRGLLAPGGMLLMLEIAGNERWVDVTFGLTEGWWRGTDAALRPDSPLLTRAAWLALLGECGFEAAALDPVDARSCEVVIAARKPLRALAAPPQVKRWLVLGDAQGVGAALARQLRERGHEASVLDAGAVDPCDAAAVRSRIASAAASVDALVHLWALDLPAPSESRPGGLVEAQRRSLGSLAAIVQALGSQSFAAGAAPRLWIATCGAQAVDGPAMLALSQAAIAGAAKSLALEHPELRPTCVDLDPDAAVEARAESLLAVLEGDEPESQLALRNGGRQVARLVPSLAGSSHPAVAPAVRLRASGSGLIDELALVPVPRRAPRAGEVEIRVEASGINFRDLMNALAMRNDPEPLGGECAGRIVAVGADVTGLAVGDAVVALVVDSFATYVTCPATHVAPIPAGLDAARAVTLPFAFMTAHYALHTLGAIGPGKSVLIHAAAGGVGSAALQLARRAGATIFATAGSESKRDWVRAQGAAHVMDSRSLDFADAVLAATNGKGVDLVLNSLAGDFVGASVRCLAADGVLLEIGKRDLWTPQRFREERPAGRYHTIDLARMGYDDPSRWLSIFGHVLGLAARGEIEPLNLRAYPLERAADAFRCMAQARHIGKVVLTQVDASRGAMDALAPEASYLVTGGLSGLGLLTAGRLVERGARHLALVGRSAPNAAASARLDALRAQGARVLVLQADVSRPEEVARVLAAIDAELPTLRGIVHSAGTLADGALLQQSDWARYAAPLGAKVEGAWALHAATLSRPLDFFVLYSSVAATLGSSGQTNHAAANAFMDALAAHRRALGLPGLSIGWAAWSEVGAAAERGIDERVHAQGLDAISPEQGLDILEALMRDAPAHVAVFPVRRAAFLARFAEQGVPAFLQRLRAVTAAAAPVPARAAPDAAAVPAASGARDEIERAAPARRGELMLEFVAQQVARVLAAPDARAIDPRQPLNEMGLDSLMAVELRNRLGSGLALERSLPATVVFEHPTLEALSRFLVQTAFPVAVAPAAPAPAAPVDAVEAIDDLTEEQIEALFAKKMRRP